MNEFIINLLPDSDSYLDTNRQKIIRNAKSFRQEYINNHQGSDYDELDHFFRDLETGGYWSVLRAIDGSDNPLARQSLQVRKDTRNWARQKFTHGELQKLLDICANTALLIPFETHCPGTYKGHSILYRELQKQDSMFYGAVDKDLQKRLHNGRFWEELPDMYTCMNQGAAYGIVNDVLVNNFEDLDLDHVPKGFEIFYRNNGKNSNFDLQGLSDNGIYNYATFVSEINKHKKDLSLKESDVELLAKPYAVAIIDTVNRYDGQGSVIRFDESSRKSYKEMLNEPLVTEYLRNSNLVRQGFAKQLHSHATYGDRAKITFDILDNVPEQKEMFDRMVSNMLTPQYDLKKLAQRCKQEGFSLTPYLGPSSSALLS